VTITRSSRRRIQVNVVTQQKVGIAEPQSAPARSHTSRSSWCSHCCAWVEGGTASAPSPGTRVADTVQQGAKADPDDPNTVKLYSLGVSVGTSYQPGMYVTVSHSGADGSARVEDVFPAPSLADADRGDTVLLRERLGAASSRRVSARSPESAAATPSMRSAFDPATVASFRRGSLVVIGGTELCYIESVTRGPDGQISFETRTVSTHTVGNTIAGFLRSACTLTLISRGRQGIRSPRRISRAQSPLA
jgi:hypothetical protein